MDDLGIVNGIKTGGLQHDRAISQLYSNTKYRQPIISYIRSKGVSASDAETIWTDLVIQFGKLVIQGKYSHQDNLIGYLKNMSRFMILNFFRDNKKYQTTDIDDELYNQGEEDEIQLYNEELRTLIISELDRLGEPCKEIMLLWSRDYSMAEIMKKIGIISIEATRKRKHTCLKKLLSNVSHNESILTQLKAYI